LISLKLPRSPPGSQNDYTQVVIFAKLCCLFGKGAFRLPKGRYASSPLVFVIPSGAGWRARKSIIFAQAPENVKDYVLTVPSLNARDNHLALSDLRNFIAKISALLVT